MGKRKREILRNQEKRRLYWGFGLSQLFPVGQFPRHFYLESKKWQLLWERWA